MAKSEDRKKSFWIPEKEFNKLVSNIWSEIDTKEDEKKIKDENPSIVAVGETIIVIG